MWNNFWFQGFFFFFFGWFNACLNIKDRMNKHGVMHILDGCCSVAQSCPTLCNPMDCSTPGLRVHHQPLEFTQTLVHCVGDAIQPSYPHLSPSAFNLSQHQGLFKWVSSMHQVAKVLEFQLQHQSFQWIGRSDFLYDWLVWLPCSPRDSQESSSTPQFKSINSLALSFLYDHSHIHTWLLEKHKLWLEDLWQQSNISAF